MDNFLADLSERHLVVDLGCGSGSFHYETYKCRIIGIDQTVRLGALPERSHASFVQADSAQVPLADRSADAVVCNHTLEHFVDFRKTLAEIDRILKDDGLLWIAVPNGHAFDDHLYRFLFCTGGHVNRFSRGGLIDEVHLSTRFRLLQEVDLFSSFVYLKRPLVTEYPYYPRRARFLFQIPKWLSTLGILSINAGTRLLDKLIGSRTSQYGWGFVFGHEKMSLRPLHKPFFNVCSRCGCGLPAAEIQKTGRLKQCFGVGLYRCPQCEQLNAFVSPLFRTE